VKLYEIGTVIIVIVGVAAIVGLLSARFLGHDGPIEETSEAIIQHHTGIDLDLSPSSPEKRA